jgi:Ger(x)C family germination protein
MDHLLRYQEFRPNMWVLVGRSDAESVVKSPVDHETVAARGLATLVENEVRAGNARASQLHMLAEEMLDKTRAATTALVGVGSQGPQPGLNVVGTAVVKTGRFIGELDQRSTRGLMWALGEVKGGSITVQCRCGRDCSVFLRRAEGRITGKMKDGRPEITVAVMEWGTLDTLECPEDPTQPGTLEFLNSQQARLIEGEIREALTRAREMNADIFGFGSAVHASYRGDWKAIERQWDRLFAEAEVNIRVETRLQYISLLPRSFVTSEVK